MSSQKNSMKRFGLARVLSKMGLASRTQAAVMIAEGLVRVNGKTIRDPEYPVRIEIDKVSINSLQVVAQQRIVLMLNKPRGLVTTRLDEKERATVYDCLPSDMPWLAPVGRLDKASEGFLLMSNDPVWASTITDPAGQIDKTYHVQVAGLVDDSDLTRLNAGYESSDGLLKAKSVRVLRAGGKNTWLEFVLDEGKNRHIRRLLQAQGIEVLRLIRVAIGGLALGSLPKGQWRTLTEAELALLDNA
ncbi:MAG: rRNA pseudouridine synthase [Arenimonas sp.]|nr:rRNA pseudouridine synthase [Arenimonas sp.]